MKFTLQFPAFPLPFRALQLAVGVACLAASADAAVIYSLNTADISGAGQNTFIAAQSASSGAGSSLGGTLPTNLTVTNGTVGASDFSYVIGDFSTVTLVNVGDSIAVNFTVTISNQLSESKGFRFGFFNVGAATNGAAPNTFNTSTGYRADFSNNNDTSQSGFRYRPGTTAGNSSVLFATGASPVIGTAASKFTYTSGDSYTGSFSITKTALGVDLSSQLGDSPTYNFSVTSGAYTSFNAVSFFSTNNGTAGVLDFTALNVTTVPEPSTLGLLGLVAAAALLTRKTRTRCRKQLPLS